MPPSARRGPRARKYDAEKTRRAVLVQARSVHDAVRELPPEAYEAGTGLGDWTVRELVAHLAQQIEILPRVLGEETPPTADLPLVKWPRATTALADRPTAGTHHPAARLTAAVTELEAALTEPLPDRLVRTGPGTLSAADFAVTRLVELVVHADDLTTATGVHVTLDRQAVATVTRLLADAFADKAPGNSVELRIPPYAAVQCVEGPRHTRGTPSNVAETDPLTWIRLATGRTTWEQAVHDAKVMAGGDRSGLSEYLPIMT